MTRFITILLLWLSSSLAVVFAQSNVDSTYVSIDDLPSASFLPAPSDTACMEFADDFYQWQWGISQRNTARGLMASEDSRVGIDRMVSVFDLVMDIPISPDDAPAIYNIMLKTGNTAVLATLNARQAHPRKSPVAQMNTHAWGAYDNETQLRSEGSYPSPQAALGWATALVLAELSPNRQDLLLSQGYGYGQSGVITGAHWQSDVDAARLCAAAAVTRMHIDTLFCHDLQAARDEYHRLINNNDSTIVQWPQGRSFLPAVVDTVSNRYYGDVIGLWNMKPERTSERGTQAIADACLSDSALLANFALVMDINPDPDSIPALTRMLVTATAALREAASQFNATNFRKRPYVQLGEVTLLPDTESEASDSSSYPSIGAQLGWGLALLLAEVDPLHQDQILERGYELGRSGIITGYHFPSDVQTARTMASAVVARLHADPAFAALLSAAKNEYITSVQP